MSTPRIIAFTKDWNDVPTCTTHILREMGRSLPVLWVSSIGTRRPNLASGRDLGRVWARLKRLFTRAEWKENQLRVLSPLLMPKAESRLMRWLNRRLFAWYVRRERDWMGDGPLEYWCFVPNAVDLVETADRRLETGVQNAERASVVGPRSHEVTKSRSQDAPCSTLIYYCVDDWSEFEHLDTAWIAGKEQALLHQADVVFATSRYLVDKCAKSATAPVHYLPHGVEHVKFAKALEARSAEHGAPSTEAEAECQDVGVSEQPSTKHHARRHDPQAPGTKHPASSAAADYAVASQAPNAERGEPRTLNAQRSTPNAPPRPALQAPCSLPPAPCSLPPAPCSLPPAPTSALRAPRSATIGFYGNLHAWVDYPLIARLATARPSWRFLLIGPIGSDVDLGPVARLPNVDCPGRVEHEELPTWCARFDAAIIPYDLHHPRMKSVNPVKARELLAAGVPIVAARLPDLEGMEPDILLADTQEQWLAALEQQIVRTDRQQISARQANQDWTAKVGEIRRIVSPGPND